MPVVLGIDAAWTATEPSGVALVQTEKADWNCVAVAPSYESFLKIVEGKPVDWQSTPFRGSVTHPTELLEAAKELAGSRVDLIAIDMPIATVPIAGRRQADHEVSVEFASSWCATHSPTQVRPGAVGSALSHGFVQAGYPIATKGTPPGRRTLLEVYPHVALLSLMGRDRRVPYKVSKSKKYWPKLSVAERIEALLREFHAISAALDAVFGDIRRQLPNPRGVGHLSRLKRYEDALDALVCAWIGAEHLAGRTVALGDATAAIWCPRDVVHGP